MMTPLRLLHLFTQYGRMQPDLLDVSVANSTAEEIGHGAIDWLLHQDYPAKPLFLEQVLAWMCSQVDPYEVGMALGVEYRIPSIVRGAFEEIMSRSTDCDRLAAWRGNDCCARLVRLQALVSDACGGLAWADDLERKGHRTSNAALIEILVYGHDYEYAFLRNTTLEQMANFCDQIEINEMRRDSGARPHRALAALLFSQVGRTLAHAALFRIAQVGTLSKIVPDLYPVSLELMEPLVAFALRCDYQASEAVRERAHWACFYISHLALAGLLADVFGGERALACMQELSLQGSMARLEPKLYGLPEQGKGEWDWKLSEKTNDGKNRV